jgi:hypothetical protein
MKDKPSAALKPNGEKTQLQQVFFEQPQLIG